MYYFSKGGFDTEYHVMAKSKAEALEYFKKHLLEKADKYSNYEAFDDSYFSEEFDFFENHPERIFEYREGEFVETEVC